MAQTDRIPAIGISGTDPFGAFLTYRPDSSVTTGPLADLTFAVKDNIAVKGHPVTAGLPLFADRVADTDAVCVRRLLEAGARFVGVTRTDAAGFGVTTPDVTNPVLPGHIVGGSSGGSAAAVAAGLADIGLGTDTGGSVRIPAACCGLFGFKPTHNRIPLDGIWPLAPGFDTAGLMARDLASLAAAAAVLLKLPARRDPLPSQLRLGLDYDRLGLCEPAIVAAIERVMQPLVSDRATLHPITLPDRQTTTQAHSTLVLNESYALYDERRDDLNQFPDLVRRAFLAAQSLTPEIIAAARLTVDAAVKDFNDCCAGLDAIIVPTLPVSPPPVGTRRMTLNGREQSIVSVLVAETCLANVTGGPALSIPLAAEYGPVAGLQLLARHGHDDRLLAIARRLEPVLRG